MVEGHSCEGKETDLKTTHGGLGDAKGINGFSRDRTTVDEESGLVPQSVVLAVMDMVWWEGTYPRAAAGRIWKTATIEGI